MASRIVVGGRVIGSGSIAGAQVKCLCGGAVEVLGRCGPCNLALQRRRLGLPPSDEQERKRLAGFLERYGAAHQRCHECGATAAPRCYSCGSKDVEMAPGGKAGKCRDCKSRAVGNEHDERCSFFGL